MTTQWTLTEKAWSRTEGTTTAKVLVMPYRYLVEVWTGNSTNCFDDYEPCETLEAAKALADAEIARIEAARFED